MYFATGVHRHCLRVRRGRHGAYAAVDICQWTPQVSRVREEGNCHVQVYNAHPDEDSHGHTWRVVLRRDEPHSVPLVGPERAVLLSTSPL